MYFDEVEQYFLFRGGTPVKPEHARAILGKMLQNLGLDHTLYGMHSLTIGRTTDLIKYQNSLDEVKQMGRWHSNVVYKYICS